ncbi:MAG TPA: hypothetical protein VIT91_05150 [Chthoniobacterales bacterium]
MTDWQTEYRSLEKHVLDFIENRAGVFEELALEVFRFQRQFNEPFRQFCEYNGVPESLDNWEKIPAVPQQAFKLSRLTTFPHSAAIREFRTSGTTGEGYGSHFFADLTLYEAAISAGWNHAGLPHFPAYCLTPNPSDAPHSSLAHMMGRFSKRFFIEHGALKSGRLRSELGTEDRPVMLLGTALAFLNWMERENAPMPLPPGSLVMETGGYKGSGRMLEKAAFYDQLAEFFALPAKSLVNEYGMTELSSQFYARGVGNPHRGGPWIRFRVIDPATGQPVAPGERGVLQLFDLANVGSAVAILTEDLAQDLGDEGFLLLGRDPAAVARGCSRAVDEMLGR